MAMDEDDGRKKKCLKLNTYPKCSREKGETWCIAASVKEMKTIYKQTWQQSEQWGSMRLMILNILTKKYKNKNLYMEKKRA